jgi:hypothetical protein
MRRRVSVSARVIRTFTALITVWCLGCSSFDPLFDSLGLATATLGMECGSGEAMNVRGTDTEAVSSPAAVRSAAGSERVVQAPGSENAPGYDCGCQSCHAPTPTQFAFVGAPSPAPDAPVSTPVALSSVVREPLVPPPQRAI